MENSDVILLCFNSNDLESFKNVELRWLPEINKYRCTTPIMLVGIHYSDTDAKNESVLENKQQPNQIHNDQNHKNQKLKHNGSFKHNNRSSEDKTSTDFSGQNVGLFSLKRNSPKNSSFSKLDRMSYVTESSSEEMASRIPGCVGFAEVILIQHHISSVKHVFDTAIFAALNHQGFIKKRRGLSSFRKSQYKFKHDLWNKNCSSPKPIPRKSIIRSNSLPNKIIMRRKNSVNVKKTSEIICRKKCDNKSNFSLKKLFSCFK